MRKKAAIIIGNNDFQDALNEALIYENIEIHPERISKTKPYISKYNWKGIEFPGGSKEWKKLEQNNKAIDFNVLFVLHSTKIIRVACRSEYNHKREKQVTLLMISDGIKWHYLAVSNLSALLEGKLSNHHGDFYRLGCFNSCTTKNRLKEHEEICNKHDCCHIVRQKNIKICSCRKITKSSICNLSWTNLAKKSRKSYTEKKAKHEHSGWAMFTKCSFDKAENKLYYYRRRDCIEKLCKKLKGHVIKIINSEKKEEMIPLSYEETRSYNKLEVCHICKKKFLYGWTWWKL